MNNIVVFLQGLDYWHWFIFAGVLLIFEVVTGGGFMLWIGISAGVVGVVMVVLPHTVWSYQFIIFAIAALVSCILWRNHLVKHPIETDKPNLNKRGAQNVGRVFTLDEAIVNNVGKVKIGDSPWRVMGDDMPVGTQVRVVGIDGVTLIVEPVDK